MTVSLWEPTGMPARIDSWTSVVADVAQLAETVASTDFVPKPLRGNVPAITATILYGREIGLPPMQALRSIFIVQGRPALYAETMRGLALAAGHEIVYERADGAICTVRGRRHGETSWHPVTWTIDQVRAAGLSGDGWRKYPRHLLKARATSELCRDLFADVIAGFAAVEDMDEVPEDAVRDAETPAPPARTVGRGRAAKRALDAPSAPDAMPGELEPPSQVDPARSRDVDPPPASLPDREGTREPARRARQRATPPDDAAAGDRSLAPPPPPSAPQDDSGHRDGTLVGTLLDEEPPPLPPEDPHLPPSPDYDEPTLPIPDEPASVDQGHKIFALLRELDYGEVSREERLRVAVALLQHPLSTFKELSRADASRLIDTLTLLSQTTDGHAQLAAIVARS